MHKLIGGCLLLLFISAEAGASDAYVLAEEEFGQGYFRQRGDECFFITAKHVVEDVVEVELITSGRNELTANVITTYPDDVAILRVELPQAMPCPQGNWGGGEKLNSLLKMYQEGVVKTRLSDGSVLQTDVKIKSYDNFRYILITPKDSNTQFAKGFSGSPFFIAGKPAGMLQSVSDGVGKVFRQDALNNTVALFFDSGAPQDTQPIAAGSSKTSPVDSQQATNSPTVIEGNISKGKTIDHHFESIKNSPLLFITPASEKGLRYEVLILDKTGATLYKNAYGGHGERKHVFTPIEDGTYTLRLVGTKSQGSYSVSMQQIVSVKELINSANVITTDDTVSGKLAKNAIAEYSFHGEANSPILFKTPGSTKGLRYSFRIVKNNEILYKNDYGGHGKREHIFTPKKDSTYTLQLVGTKHYGDFSISMQQITTDTELIGKANVISIGETVEGSIAQKAVAKYSFKGEKNSPLLFITPASPKGLRYIFEIFERKKALYKSAYGGHGNREHIFTPPKSGDYTLVVTGTKHFGDYTITMEQITTNEVLTSNENEIQIGDEVDGILAVGSIAEYRFKGEANSPILFATPKSPKGLRYTFQILQRSKELYKNGNGGNGNREHVFTPPKTGDYKVVLIGTKHYGDYAITMDQIAVNAELKSNNNVIEVGGEVEGALAVNSVAEYQFIGKANSKLVFSTLKSTKGMRYQVQILSGNKVLYKNGYGGHGNREHLFKPPNDGAFTLRLTGTKHYDDFVVSLGQAD